MVENDLPWRSGPPMTEAGSTVCQGQGSAPPPRTWSCQETSRNVTWAGDSAKTSHQQVRGEGAAKMGEKMDTW